MSNDGTGIGKLTRVPLCEVWKHEALDFTRWLEQNLSRAITADLATVLDAEAPAMVRSMSSAVHREAGAASVEKRLPAAVGTDRRPSEDRESG